MSPFLFVKRILEGTPIDVFNHGDHQRDFTYIDDIVEVFRKQQGKLVTAERAAVKGDTLVIDFEGFRDGEAFEGGSGEGTSLELGSGRMIPGFEDGLIDASVSVNCSASEIFSFASPLRAPLFS